MRNVFLERIFYIFCLAIFVLPLERIGSLSYSGVNIRLSQILVIVIFIFYLLYSLLNKKIKIIFSQSLVYYILFLLACLVSLVFAKEKMRGLMISAFLIFMLIIPMVSLLLVDNKDKLKKSLKILIYSAILFSVFGFFQFFGDLIGIPTSITGLSDRYVKTVIGIPRIQSTFIEPLYFANYLIIPLMISVFLLIRKGYSKKSRVIYFLLSLFFLTAIFLTLSKGAILAVAILIFGIFIFQIRFLFSRENLPYIFSIVGFILLISWFALSTIQSIPDFDSIYAKAYGVMTGGSVTERLGAYDNAMEAYNTSPVIGIGVGNFGPYYSGYPLTAPDYGWPIANNEYLEVLSETGIVGLLLFLLFLISIFYYSYKSFKSNNDPELKIFLLALNFALIGILIQYLTFSTLYIMHFWFLIGLILSAQRIMLINNIEEDD